MIPESHYNLPNSVLVQYQYPEFRNNHEIFQRVQQKVSEYNPENCRPTQGTMRKSHRTFTVTRHLLDNKSKATSSLFLFKFCMTFIKMNPAYYGYFYLLHSYQFLFQYTCTVTVISMFLQAKWKTVWILISWLLRSQLIWICTVFKTKSK